MRIIAPRCRLIFLTTTSRTFLVLLAHNPFLSDLFSAYIASMLNSLLNVGFEVLCTKRENKQTAGKALPPPKYTQQHSETPDKKNNAKRWEKGDGRLLPEFQCHRDLYEHKLRQQEALSKQLRRQQRSIKENEGAIFSTSAHDEFSCRKNRQIEVVCRRSLSNSIHM